MPDFGLKVFNASNFIQIDSHYRNYSLIKTGEAYSDWSGDFPNIIATFPSQSVSPIVTFRPPRRHYVSLNGVTATQAWFQASKNASRMIKYQVWQRGIVTPATWGMNINNASGNTVFSSEDRHFVVKTAFTITNATIRSALTQPLAGNTVTLASPNNYVIISPAGAREKYNLPPVGEGWLQERACGWSSGKNHVNNDTNATFTVVGRNTTHYPTDFYGATSNTGNATVTLIDVINTIPGMFQKWAPVRTFSSFDQGNIMSLARVGVSDLIMGFGLEAQIWRATACGKAYLQWTLAQNFGATAPSLSVINQVDAVTATLCLAAHESVTRKGLILRSTDGGNSWTDVKTTPLNDESWESIKGITHAIAVAGKAPVFVLGAKLYRSTDYGQTWSNIKSYNASLGEGVPTQFQRVSDTTILSNGGFFIWRSSDAGSTWTKVLNMNNATPSQLGPTSFAHVTGSIYIAGSSTPPHIWRSIDDGQNWVKEHNFGATSNVHPQTSVTALVSTDGTTCIAGTAPGGQLWRSDNKGITWPILLDELVYHSPGGNFISDLVLCATNQVLAPTRASGMLWRTFDYTT